MENLANVFSAIPETSALDAEILAADFAATEIRIVARTARGAGFLAGLAGSEIPVSGITVRKSALPDLCARARGCGISIR